MHLPNCLFWNTTSRNYYTHNRINSIYQELGIQNVSIDYTTLTFQQCPWITFDPLQCPTICHSTSFHYLNIVNSHLSPVWQEYLTVAFWVYKYICNRQSALWVNNQCDELWVNIDIVSIHTILLNWFPPQYWIHKYYNKIPREGCQSTKWCWRRFKILLVSVQENVPGQC